MSSPESKTALMHTIASDPPIFVISKTTSAHVIPPSGEVVQVKVGSSPLDTQVLVFVVIDMP